MGTFVKVIKWVVGVGLVVVLICGGAAAFLVPKISTYYREQQEKGRGTLVVVEPVKLGQLIRTVAAPGTIAAKTTTSISARVSAKINSINFEEGNAVKENDILIELDAQELVAALESTKARYAADLASIKSIEANLAAEEARIIGSQAQHRNALSELERQQELYASGDVSKSSLDNASTEVDRMKSTYEAALKGLDAAKANVEAGRARAAASHADVDRAERNVEYCTIRAPFAGLITRRIAQVGETALGTIQNAGTQLMVLEDVSEMLVKARLAETDAPRVAAAQKVKVYVNGYPDQTFEGVLRRVGMTSLRWAADNTYYFDAEIVLDTKAMRLSSGTTANVDIEIETMENVLLVPSQAVLDKRVDSLPQKLREENPLVDRDKTFAKVVMLKKDGKTVYTPVRTVASSISQTAIAEGVSADDPVIVGPFKALQELAHDTKVRTEEEDKALRDKGKKPEPEVADKDKPTEEKTAEAKPAKAG